MDEEKKEVKKKTAIHESTKLLIGILISGLVFGVLGFYLGDAPDSSFGTSSVTIPSSLPDGMSPPPVPPEPTESVSPTAGDLPTVAPNL